jgi:DNA-binding transcriptional LysR family regulator
MLPESVVRDHLRTGLLKALPVVVGESLQDFGLLLRKDEALNDSASFFVTRLRSLAAARRGPR